MTNQPTYVEVDKARSSAAMTQNGYVGSAQKISTTSGTATVQADNQGVSWSPPLIQNPLGPGLLPSPDLLSSIGGSLADKIPGIGILTTLQDPNFVRRVLFVAIGIILIIVGVLVIFRQPAMEIAGIAVAAKTGGKLPVK